MPSLQIVKRADGKQYAMIRDQEKADSKQPLSVCDVMRDSTNEVIMKMEGLLPLYMEGFADINAEGMRIAKDFFGTCYIAEKEILDKMGVDQDAIKSFERYAKMWTQPAITQIEIAGNCQKMFVENMMSAMESYDDHIRLMLSSYAKMLEYASAAMPQKT